MEDPHVQSRQQSPLCFVFQVIWENQNKAAIILSGGLLLHIQDLLLCKYCNGILYCLHMLNIYFTVDVLQHVCKLHIWASTKALAWLYQPSRLTVQSATQDRLRNLPFVPLTLLMKDLSENDICSK